MQRLKRPWTEAAAKIDDVTWTKFPHTKPTHSCMYVILTSSMDVILSIQTQLIRTNAPQIHATLVINIQICSDRLQGKIFNDDQVSYLSQVT